MSYEYIVLMQGYYIRGFEFDDLWSPLINYLGGECAALELLIDLHEGQHVGILESDEQLLLMDQDIYSMISTIMYR